MSRIWQPEALDPNKTKEERARDHHASRLALEPVGLGSNQITPTLPLAHRSRTRPGTTLLLTNTNTTLVIYLTLLYAVFACALGQQYKHNMPRSTVSDSTYPESTAGPASPIFGTASFSTFTATALTSLWPSSSSRRSEQLSRFA